MKLFLITGVSLRPYVEKLISDSLHEIEPFYLSDSSCRDPVFLQEKLWKTGGYDAILLTNGSACIPDNGLRAGDVPFVLPRVHNSISLLLGNAAIYRNLFHRYGGGLCWALAGMEHPLYFAPAADCSCLCYLADVSLGIADTSLFARAIAQKNQWDYFEQASDSRFLARLLNGQWDGEDIVKVAPGQSVFLTYQNNLFA